MEETKFRAWDKKDKIMIPPIQKFIPLRVTNIGVLRLDPHSKEDRWVLMEKERFILMASTGQKNKKGAEIYQGDILDSDPEVCPDDDPCPYEVVFSDGAFRIKYGSSIAHSVLSRSHLSINNDVIKGNIYENPELLK